MPGWIPSAISSLLGGAATSEITVEDLWSELISGCGEAVRDALMLTTNPAKVFPIKSCRGIQIQSSGFTATGLDYDRNWMIVEEKTHKFLTARTVPRMILIGTAISIPDGTLTITVPESSEYPETSFTVPLAPPSDDTAWHPDFKIWSSPALDGWVVGSEECQKLLSAYMGKPVLLIQKGREPREAGPTGYVQGLPGVSLQYTEHPSVSFADEYPILVVGRDSLNHLDHLVMTDKAVQDAQPRFDREKWKDGGIEIQRFRGNVVVKGCEPWVEESWQAVRFIPVEEGAEQEDWEIVSRCGRCQLPNVDPATAIRDPVVPDMFMQETRKTSPTMPTKLCFGVNAVPGRRKGTIRVGDKVQVLRRVHEKRSDGSFIRPEDLECDTAEG